MDYLCKCCEYHTTIKANFNKHLLSQKHKLKTENAFIKGNDLKSINSQPKVNPKSTFSQPEVSPKSFALFECKYCEQKFKFKQSMYKHIKYSCTKNKEEDLNELVRLMNNKFESQAKQIEKLMGKLEIHGSFNNNTINNITLLNYTDTDVSHLTEQDYKKCIKKVCFCVMGLIEKIHFNPDKPENMNIYISNIKDKYLMVYQNGKWNLKNKKELDQLYDEKEYMIEQWIEENKDPEMEQFFKRYLHLKKDDKTMQMINDELKLMMFNNKNLIE